MVLFHRSLRLTYLNLASTPCFSQPFEQSVSSPNNYPTVVPPVPAVQQNYDLNNRGQSPPQYSAWDIINIVQGAAIGCVNMPVKILNLEHQTK